MSEKKNKLTVIDGETLMDTRLDPTKFCIDSLLPQGITILGGAPKIGKSWLVLDICIRIAKGESVWNMPTAKGTTLYLCLEDTLRRVQERLNCITDDVPSNAFLQRRRIHLPKVSAMKFAPSLKSIPTPCLLQSIPFRSCVTAVWIPLTVTTMMRYGR